jgi:hypothetical protein
MRRLRNTGIKNSWQNSTGFPFQLGGGGKEEWQRLILLAVLTSQRKCANTTPLYPQ